MSGAPAARTPLAVMAGMNNGMRMPPARNGLKAPMPKQQPPQQRQQQQQLGTSAGGETATFLSFVRLLATKSEDEQRMLMQVAMQEAATGPPPQPQRQQPQQSPTISPGGLRRSNSADSLRRNPLRRSASVDGSDFAGRAGGGGMAVMTGVGQANGAAMLAGPDGRPRSADSANGLGWTVPGLASASGARANPLRQRQQQVLHQRAAAQLHQQFARRAAAATLQAHWRGWQHRRLARYLRARRKRAMRLDWLWHLEYVTNLMHWHEAAHTLQANWRGHHSRRQPPPSAEAAKAADKARSPPRATKEQPPPSTATSDGAADAAADGQSTAAPQASAAPQACAEGVGSAAGSAAEGGQAGAEGGGRREMGLNPRGARLTVCWRPELAEVRQYNVPPPPRW